MGILRSLFGSSVETISTEELNQQLKSNKSLYVIDVRQPSEYQQGHIKGSKLVPLNKLKQQMGKLPKQKEIICVCRSGGRSSQATKLLEQAGFNAKNLRGGMMAWQRSNLPMKKGK